MSYIIVGLIFVAVFYVSTRKDKSTGKTVVGSIVGKITGKPL